MYASVMWYVHTFNKRMHLIGLISLLTYIQYDHREQGTCTWCYEICAMARFINILLKVMGNIVVIIFWNVDGRGKKIILWTTIIILCFIMTYGLHLVYQYYFVYPIWKIHFYLFIPYEKYIFICLSHTKNTFLFVFDRFN
jgi:hypothetical protein